MSQSSSSYACSNDVLDVKDIKDRILKCAYADGKMKLQDVECKISTAEMMFLVQKAKEVISAEPVLLELEAPINVVGDLHGQFFDLLRIFDKLGHPPKTKYLFLGDYVDRGPNSIETMALVLAYKVLHPDKVFILRGNHETQDVSRIYGFYDECKRRYAPKMWRLFVDCFGYLPLAATINQRIYCAHGGISPGIMETLTAIRELQRPLNVADQGVVTDILWSDPDASIMGWEENERGVSFTFGADVLYRFLKKHNFDMVCRAHQVVEDGYEFFGDRKLVTIFSATNYCGEFDNDGGVLRVSEDLVCSFCIFKPVDPDAKTIPCANAPESA